MTPFRFGFLSLVVSVTVAAAPARAQTTYTWNDSTSEWLQTSAWTPTSPSWAERDRLGDATAAFGNQATIGSGTPTIQGDLLYARGITINNTGADWNITGGGSGNSGGVLALGAGGITVTGGGTTTITANVNITRSQTWDVGTSTTLNMGGTPPGGVGTGSTGVLSGFGTLTKAGAGTLVVNNIGNTFTGTVAIASGTLTVGSSTLNAAGASLRNAAIDFGTGSGSLTLGGSDQGPRIGQISGSNAGATVSMGNQTIHVLALGDATFAGSVSSTGGLRLYGPGNQAFTGNTTGLAGNVIAFSGATLTLSGTGDNTSGVLGGIVTLEGGSVVFDNSAGNTSAGGGRLSNTATINFVNGGSTLRLIGSAAGTSETVSLTTSTDSFGITTAKMLYSGSHTIRVDHTGGAGGTQWNFNTSAASFTLQAETGMTVNFVGTGGTLGAAGANPRVVFTGGTPYTSLQAGLLSSVSGIGSDSFVGWATVNGNEWAGYGPNGIVAVAPTLVSPTNTGIQGAGAFDLVVFNPTSNQTLNAAVTAETFKITPNGATSLSVGAHNINTPAIMLDGPNSFAITGTTGKLFGTTGGLAHYVHVIDSGAVLSTDLSLAEVNVPVVKSGAGTFALTGTTNQLGFTASQNIYVVQGTLRATLAALGGGTSADGDFTTISLRGGVLEIDGAGSGGSVTFTRALDVSGNNSGGGLTFDSGPTNRGQGGFSAINAPGGVNIKLVTTVGGSTTAALQWNDTKFVAEGYALLFGSSKADSRVTLVNDIALDIASGLGAATTYSAREIRVFDNPASGGDIATLIGVISGTSLTDLVKTGPGVLELSGSNTYRGNTLVTSGTLWVNNSTGSGTGHGSVIVSSGATLGGSGLIDPAPDAGLLSAVVIRSGGAVRGGTTGTTGTLTVTSDMTLEQGAILRVEASRTGAGAANASKIDMTGPASILNLNAGTDAGTRLVIDVVSSAANPLQANETYSLTLASVAAPGNVWLNGSSLGANSVISSSLYTLQSASLASFGNVSLAIDGTGQNLVLTFTASPVPEPTTVLALAAGALLVWRAVRRRTKATVGNPTHFTTSF